MGQQRKVGKVISTLACRKLVIETYTRAIDKEGLPYEKLISLSK
jgi:hypothetical protein